MGDSLLSINWPTAVLLLGLVLILAFRPQLAKLLSKSKKIGPGGWEGQDPAQPPATETDQKISNDFFKTFENPLLRELEDRILADLAQRKLEAPPDREKALLKTLAITQISLHFERAYKNVYASQLALLVHLNSRLEGESLANVRPFYEQAALAYPPLYENHSFDAYLAFLESYNLITRQGDLIATTLAGREFLKYLVDTRKVLPNFG